MGYLSTDGHNMCGASAFFLCSSSRPACRHQPVMALLQLQHSAGKTAAISSHEVEQEKQIRAVDPKVFGYFLQADSAFPPPTIALAGGSCRVGCPAVLCPRPDKIPVIYAMITRSQCIHGC